MVSMACLSFFASPSNNAISLGSVFTRNLLLIPKLRRSNPVVPDFNRDFRFASSRIPGQEKKLRIFLNGEVTFS